MHACMGRFSYNVGKGNVFTVDCARRLPRSFHWYCKYVPSCLLSGSQRCPAEMRLCVNLQNLRESVVEFLVYSRNTIHASFLPCFSRRTSNELQNLSFAGFPLTHQPSPKSRVIPSHETTGEQPNDTGQVYTNYVCLSRIPR